MPLVANVVAGPISDPAEIRRRLVEQVTGMVRWRESMQWLGGAGVDVFRRGRRRQGAVGPRPAHRRGRRDAGRRHARGCRRRPSPSSAEGATGNDVRTDRQARPGHRRQRRASAAPSPARSTSRARPSGCPARGARRWTRSPPNSASARHVLPCDLGDAAAGRATRAGGGGGLRRRGRHPRQQCRRHPRQAVRAHVGRGLGEGARRQPDGGVPPVARRAARHDAPPLRAHHLDHFGRRRHRQPRPGQLRRLQGRPDRHDQVAGRRDRQPQRHRQLRRAGLHRPRP